MENSLTLSPSQVARLLAKTIPSGKPVLLSGPPGVGKTDVASQAAAAADAELIITHPVVADQTDYKGLPWPGKDGASAVFLPFGDFARILSATKRTVVLIDDVGLAAPSVQGAVMQLVLARRVGEHVVPDCVTFIACTNRRGDRAGVQGILEPLKSRFVTIIEMAPSLDAWREWAFANGIDNSVIAFAGFKPELLSKPEPTADMTNSPSPRGWASVSSLLQLDLDRDLQVAAFSGAVGRGAAGEFVAFQRSWEDMPDPDAILLDVANAPIPEEPSVLHAVATALASRATPKNFGRIIAYAQRLHADRKGAFGTLTILSAMKKDPTIKTKCAPDMAKLAVSPLGKSILGTE